MLTDGQRHKWTDGNDKDNRRFSRQCERAQKWAWIRSYLRNTTCVDSIGLSSVSVTMCILCVRDRQRRDRETDRQTERERETDRAITSYHIKTHATTWGFTLHSTSHSQKVTLQIQVFSDYAPRWMIRTFRRHSDPRNVGEYSPVHTKYTSQKTWIFSDSTERTSNISQS